MSVVVAVLGIGCNSTVANPPASSSASEPERARVQGTETVADIADHARRSVFVVRTPKELGTGFLVSAGVAVTNLHVIDGADRIELIDSDSRSHPVSAVLAVAAPTDLALLYSDDLGAIHPLSIADDTKIRPGDAITVVGTPQGLEATVSTGVMSARRSLADGSELLQITAPISPGSSGGPVLDEHGGVVGVTRGFVQGQNLNFAIPGRYVRELLAAPMTPIEVASFALSRPSRTTPEPLPSAAPPREPARPRFPESVSGFRLGMTLHEAAAACPGILGDQTFAHCNNPPIALPFAEKRVLLQFTSGHLTSVTLVAVSRQRAARALIEKYGPPPVVEAWRQQNWHAADDWKEGRRGRFGWQLDGGSLTLATTNNKVFTIRYASQAGAKLQQENY
jgi:hypothetical protein